MTVRLIPDHVRVFTLDTELVQIELQADGDDLFLVILDGHMWIELPVSARDEVRAAWRIANQFSDALSLAARRH